MRVFAIHVGCLISTLLATLLLSPYAHADDGTFIAAAKALGFQQWDDNLIRLGRSACFFLIRNDPDVVVARISRYANQDPAVAQQFLALAVGEYCPQYTDRVTP
jgi:hypothetical protein